MLRAYGHLTSKIRRLKMFEALKRFGDYEELTDGTLMRMEGNKEFRIYCEDSGWLRGRNGGRGVIVTSGFCRALSEATTE